MYKNCKKKSGIGIAVWVSFIKSINIHQKNIKAL